MTSTNSPKEDLETLVVIIEDSSDSDSDQRTPRRKHNDSKLPTTVTETVSGEIHEKETITKISTTTSARENDFETEEISVENSLSSNNKMEWRIGSHSKSSIPNKSSVCKIVEAKTNIACQPPSSTSCSPRANRRKMSHNTLKAAEDISFITYVEDENKILEENEEIQNKRRKKSLSNSDNQDYKSITETWDKVTSSESELNNPNADLMKKIAFLRGCVNYLMMNMGMEEFNFTGNVTLSWLMENYHKEKARLEGETSLNECNVNSLETKEE